jgi:hypothetical protein
MSLTVGLVCTCSPVWDPWDRDRDINPQDKSLEDSVGVSENTDQ